MKNTKNPRKKIASTDCKRYALGGRLPWAIELFAGVDMATAEIRALAVDGSGQVHAESNCRLPEPSSPRPGWVEQDARQWWPVAASVLRELTDRLGDVRHQIVALSVCATSATVVVLGDDGEPLGPALMYSDQRAEQQAATAQAAAEGRWAEIGLRIQPSFGLPKWAWLLEQRELAAEARRLAHASDVVVGRLIGGPPPTDWSHALKSGYDPKREEWVSEAMEALGIPLGLLPDVVRPTEVAGRVIGDAAAATGLPPSCEVRLGMTDACASQLAAGAGEPGRFVSVLGSTLVLKGASHDLVADPAGAVYSHRHPEGWWLPGGASSTGAAALTSQFPEVDLAAWDEKAARRGPAGVVTYPLCGRGERFPFAEPDAEGFWLGEPGDDVERYRAVLEGVAFVERLGYERLAELGAEVEPPLSLAGKASRSPVWNQIRATVLNVPVEQRAGASTALGACVLASGGAIRPVQSEAEFEPDGRERDALEESYGRFVDALRERGWVD